MRILKLGFGRCDFTPDPPVMMNSTLIGTEVLDRLYVSCLAWRDENTTVLQYSMDIRNIYDPFYEWISGAISKAVGIPKECLILSVTHNHSAPDVGILKNDKIYSWIETVAIPAMISAAKEALLDLSPVISAEGGRATTEKLGFVRRYQREDGSWSGIASRKSNAPIVRTESQADPELRAVKVLREGKKSVALINFQTHAASGLGNFPGTLHSDFVGTLRRELEKDGELLCFYLQGACGNVNCNAVLEADKIGWPDDCFKIGVKMADYVKTALEEATPLALGSISLKNDTLTCFVNHARTHLAPIAKEISRIEDKEERIRARDEAGITSKYELAAIIRRSEFGNTREMPLSSLVLGELAMGFAPVELFDTCGKMFRDASSYPMTFFCGYTNGSHSYMPSAMAFPHEGYEVLQCHYVPGTGEMIALKLAEMIHS